MRLVKILWPKIVTLPFFLLGTGAIWDPFDPSHNFCDEGHPTATSHAQQQCEVKVRDAYSQFLLKNNGRDSEIYSAPARLYRDAHLNGLLKGLENFPSRIPAQLQSSQTWYLYWILHSLSLLQEPVCKSERHRLKAYLMKCQHPEGGFGGGPGQDAHVCSTYAGLAALVYLGILDKEMQEGCLEYLHSLQTYEGGICGHQGGEAHAGYTYCALAASKLLPSQTKSCFDTNWLIRWLKDRQCKVEGGFSGRTNKLVDSCYSFWVGACFKLLDETDFCHPLYDRISLASYILLACQNATGGFCDRPGSLADYYHTCYSLSALSLVHTWAQKRKAQQAAGLVDNSNTAKNQMECNLESSSNGQRTRQYKKFSESIIQEIKGMQQIDPVLNICIKEITTWRKNVGTKPPK